jgi:hypothetical protein
VPTPPDCAHADIANNMPTMSTSVFLIVFIIFPFVALDAYEKSSDYTEGLPIPAKHQ